jgi:hypothetical protein
LGCGTQRRTTDLQPMLGSDWVYRCQLNWARNEQQETWAFVLSGLDRRLVQLAVEWLRHSAW